MTLVVADTTPVRYLARLFVNLWIPGTGASELRHARAPGIVRKWARQLPSRAEVREIIQPVVPSDRLLHHGTGFV